jgi:hypothetical protein
MLSERGEEDNMKVTRYAVRRRLEALRKRKGDLEEGLRLESGRERLTVWRERRAEELARESRLAKRLAQGALPSHCSGTDGRHALPLMC